MKKILLSFSLLITVIIAASSYNKHMARMIYCDMRVTSIERQDNDYIWQATSLDNKWQTGAIRMPQPRGHVGDTAFVSYDRLLNSWFIMPSFYSIQRTAKERLQKQIYAIKHSATDTLYGYVWNR